MTDTNKHDDNMTETGLRTSEPTFKVRLDDSDKKIFEEILAELKKANNTLEQILNHFKNRRRF
jgi:hypothetical protein